MVVNSIIQSPITGYILAIIGLIISVYFGKNGKREKTISYCKHTRRLVLPRDIITPELHILFGDKEIGNVSVSLYTLWNSGNETIRIDDIVSAKPLEIIATDHSEILDAQIIKRSEDSCAFGISYDINKSILGFDYIDPSDGVVIQIIHTGDLSDLDGRIKGGKIELFKPQRNNRLLTRFRRVPKSRRKSLKVFALLSASVALVNFAMAVLSTCMVFHVISENTMIYKILFMQPSKPDLIVLMCLCWIVFFLYSFFSSIIVQRAFLIGIPPKLRIEER